MSVAARKGRPPATVHFCDCGAVAKCRDGSGWHCWPCGPYVEQARRMVEEEIAKQRGWVMRRGIAVPPPVPGTAKGRKRRQGKDGRFIAND